MNGTASVSPEKICRVQKEIEALNYLPDLNARHLRTGRSGLYGLIISDITNPFFPEIVKTFQDMAVEQGHDVLIANTDYDPERMKKCVVRMMQRKVDGIAIMTSEVQPGIAEMLVEHKVPTVVMDGVLSERSTSVVRVDYEGGMRQAVTHLVGLGHSAIAFISGPTALNSAFLRKAAYQKELVRHRISECTFSHWTQESNHRVEGGREAMRRILDASGKLPTAVISSNDLTAMGAMSAIREAGLRIPDDVSVLGFDGILLSGYTQPLLTTVSVPRSRVATEAFRVLIRDRTASVHEAQEYVIQPELLVRESTAPPSR